MRKFEKVSPQFIMYDAHDIILPVRATKNSVCYDFYSPIDIVVKPGANELIWTNVKAQFEENVGLMLAVRSSMGKNSITLANSVGIIECDYYNNESNDGNLGFRLYNYGDKDYVIKVGDKIGQGYFFNFLTVDNEVVTTEVRKGGFGSTDKK